MKKTSIYLDHAAATPLDPAVFLAMRPFLTSNFANPSSLHSAGVEAKKAVENARATLEKFLGAMSKTVYFTSGGTEANNWAIGGLIFNIRNILNIYNIKKPEVVTTPIEHSSVLEPLRELEKRGEIKLKFAPVDKTGSIKVDDVKKLITKNTVLISIGYANNEIGTVQPIAEIGKMILRYRINNKTVYPYFHIDACQAVNYLDLSVERLHVDLLTLNASKIYGPKGVGALFVRRGVKLSSLILGGGQEFGLRSGTENVAGIVGMSVALTTVNRLRTTGTSRLRGLQKYFVTELLKIPGVSLNGPIVFSSPIRGGLGWGQRLPNNIHIRIAGFEAETLVLYLDAAGIACSSTSACHSESGAPSHVLKAVGLSDAEAKECLRFTLGRGTTIADLVFTVKKLKGILKLLK